VPAELRWIVGKACAAEPERRYRDAAELGEDVARFVAMRTVSAHPPSRWYSMQKFVRRHRGSVLGSLVIVLGVLASAGVALWQAQVAREQAQRAQAVRDFVLGIFEAAKEDLPRDARPTPDVLVRAAAKKLEGDTALSPALRADFLDTLSRISYSSNDYAQAVAQAEQGLAALDVAGAQTTRAALDLQIRRANALVSLGKPEEADKILGARVDALRSVEDEAAVEGLVAYASARILVGHVDEAIALVREAAQLAPTIYGRDDKQTLIVAATYGDILAYAGHDREAATELKALLERWRDSGVPPDHYYANSLQNLATATYHLGDRAESERQAREALALLRQIYTAPHEKIADTLFSLATPLMDAGRNDEAETLLLEAASMYSALFGPNHPQNAAMLDGLGSLEIHRGRYPKAAQYLERATKICTDAKLEDNPDCARFWQNLSAAYLRLERTDDAAAANQHSLELRRHLFGEQHPTYARSLAGRAGVELAQGKAAAALASADQALAIFSAKGLADSLGGATMRRIRAAALRDLHRAGEGIAVLDEADAIARRTAPGDVEYRSLTLALRAELLADSGRTDEAASAARSVIALTGQRATIGEARWKRLETLAR
jgi:serine/threonine-protein kinase